MGDEAGKERLFFSDLRRRLKKRRWDSERKLWSEKKMWAVHAHGDEAEDKYEEGMVKSRGTNHDVDGIELDIT